MKSETAVQKAIKVTLNAYEIMFGQSTLKLLIQILPYERAIIEKAFEDGIGEAMTDPERPLTGKEYYDIKYGEGLKK